jgi:hypothetical protein
VHAVKLDLWHHETCRHVHLHVRHGSPVALLMIHNFSRLHRQCRLIVLPTHPSQPGTLGTCLPPEQSWPVNSECMPALQGSPE